MPVHADAPVAVLSGFLDALGSLDPDRAFSYFATDGTFAFPYAPPGMPAQARGEKQLAAMLRGMAMFDDIAIYDREVHATDDAEVAIATFAARAHLRGGRPYANRYVSVARIRDGRILEYSEYFGPIALITAFPWGRRLQVLALLAMPAQAREWVLRRLGRRR